MKTVVIIPAFNEQDSIEKVVTEIPEPFNGNVIVVDNGSTDLTATAAGFAGAKVVCAPVRGYGSACLAGIAEAKKYNPEIYIFLDADYSDYPQDMTTIVDHLIKNNLDLVIGSRTLGVSEPGALLPQARYGNWFATTLMTLRFGYRFTDLGPFRAIRAKALERLEMCDTNFGWTMEMQVKALRAKLRVGEVPVRYRKRVGKSKITGTLRGTLGAGFKILWTLARYSVGTFDGEIPKRKAAQKR